MSFVTPPRTAEMSCSERENKGAESAKKVNLLVIVGSRGRKRGQRCRQPERNPVMFESEDVSE